MSIGSNLFVIGAPKSGTTAFVKVLSNHPDIFVPQEKEPRYFDAETFYDFKEDYPIKSMEEYLSIFNSSESQAKKYRVDGSVFNMYSKKSIENILKLSPNAKFIIIVRDPLSATKSMFSQRMKYLSPQMREVSDSFAYCWSLIENGDRALGRGFPEKCRNKFIFRYDLLYSYEKYLPALKELIQNDNLYIASYSEYRKEPLEFYKKIFDFLEVSSDISIENKVVNKSFRLKTTFRLKLIGFISSKTFRLRRKLGINSNILKYIKKIFIGKAVASQEISNKSDARIKTYFKKTYDYLESIKIKV